VVAFLAAGPPAAERLGRIGRRGRHQTNLLGREPGEREAGGDRPRGETDLELASAQALFVDRETKLAVLQERGTGIVPIPDTENVHRVLDPLRPAPVRKRD